MFYEQMLSVYYYCNLHFKLGTHYIMYLWKAPLRLKLHEDQWKINLNKKYINKNNNNGKIQDIRYGIEQIIEILLHWWSASSLVKFGD